MKRKMIEDQLNEIYENSEIQYHSHLEEIKKKEEEKHKKERE